jgi:hypothetical protein
LHRWSCCCWQRWHQTLSQLPALLLLQLLLPPWLWLPLLPLHWCCCHTWEVGWSSQAPLAARHLQEKQQQAIIRMEENSVL